MLFLKRKSNYLHNEKCILISLQLFQKFYVYDQFYTAKNIIAIINSIKNFIKNI